jgi:hypothetical protein
MAQYFDRYKQFRGNGTMKPLPFIEIPESSSDLSVMYRKGQSRLDKVSFSYYNSPYYGWLIMLANPQYGGLEFNIPDMTTLRIPFPLESGLERYTTQINNNRILYGE